MIEDRISNSLIDMGYLRVDSNSQGIYLFYRVEDNVLTMVSCIHAATGNELTAEQYLHVLEQMKANFRNRYPNKIRHLSLVFTGNPDLAKGLITEAKEDNHWLIDTATNRLIIYETQENSFQEIKSLIELHLEEAINLNEGTQQYVDDSKPAYNSASSQSNYGRGYPKNNTQDNNATRTTNRYLMTPVTMGIIAVNILVYLISHFTQVLGGREAIFELGGLSWYYVVQDKEYYRILTSMFLHADWSHLFNNMLVLLFVGGNLERAAGKLKYLFIYFGAGIVAGIASIGYNMWKEYADTTIWKLSLSIGASGAIFGIVGAILFVVIINRGRIQGISIRQMILFVILSLYSGIIDSHIDQAAHIGGFIGGFLIAVLIYRKPKSKERLLHEN